VTGSECGTCRPTVVAGGACTTGSQCAGSLQCMAGVCRSLPGSGEACSATTLCGYGLVCANGRCTAASKAGEPCATLPCNTLAGLTCINGVCEAWQYANPGESCSPQAGRLCRRAGYCKVSPGSTSGTCVAGAAEGEACDDLAGPFCVPYARCSGGICKVRDPTVCK
jgi:hypothetical protein